MINVELNAYQVRVDPNNPGNYLPMEIGLEKGDLIIFRDSGAPIRFSTGNSSDKVLVTDPTSPTGWVLKSYNAGGGGGGGSPLITLKNNTGATIASGTIVTFDEEGEDLEVRKATSNDGRNLFISSDDYETGEDMDCYAYPYSICNVLCSSDAVNVGDKICVSSSAGLGHSGNFATIGIALTSKESGATGTVKVQLGLPFTMGTDDLEDGVSSLPTGHIYFYYEEPEE